MARRRDVRPLRRRRGPGAGLCHHLPLRARDLRPGVLAAVQRGIDAAFSSFLNDVAGRDRGRAPKSLVEPPPPSALLLGDDQHWKCSAVPVAPDALLSAAHCLPATRALDEDDMTHELRTLAVTATARSPDPRADAALLRVKVREPLRVPPRRRVTDDTPPVGVLCLVGYGDHAYAGGSPFGRRSSIGRPPTDDERKARREARKQALEAVINAQTDRGNRLGERVFSLGSTIGPSAGFSRALREGNRDYTAFTLVPLMATLGVAFDLHERCGWGLHAELAPFNLGGYAAGRDGREGSGSDSVKTAFRIARPGPLDLIAPTALLGATYVAPESDAIFTGGFAFSYLPKFEGKEGRDESSIYAGVLLGVYVPLLDFN